MASQFAAVTNIEISQIIEQTIPEIHEEGEEIRLEVLTGKALSVWFEFTDETGEKGFCLQMQIELKLALLYLAYMIINNF